MICKPFFKQMSALIVIAILPSACAVERAETEVRPNGLDAASISPMTQIATSSSKPMADQLERTSSHERIDQVAADRRVDGNASPENDLVRDVASEGPDMALYREVALAWQAIRARGQQPSPELLAQSVGPDNLATFLSTFRNADRMFRPDIDTWPVAPIAAPAPPSTGYDRK